MGLALIVGGLVIQAVSATPMTAVPLLGTMPSWRLTFLIVGLPGLLAAALLYTVREPARKGILLSTAGVAQSLSLAQTVHEFAKRWRSMFGVAVGLMLVVLCGYAYSFWAPVYLQRVHGWSASQAGLSLGVVMVVCGCVGLFLGGRLADYWLRRGVREAALRVCALATAGAAVFIAAAFLSPSAWWTVALMVPAHIFAAMPNGSCLAAVQLIFPNQVRGQAAALLILILNLGGLTLGPLLPGFFNDHIYHSDLQLGRSIVLTTSVSAVLGIAVCCWAMRHYRRDHELMQPG
jgi:predicted MFS family arabinose efflux permease